MFPAAVQHTFIEDLITSKGGLQLPVRLNTRILVARKSRKK